MSNEKRFEMTNSIDIDLESIPHPKDCYPVPVGATIPPNTPFWVVDRWGAEWLPTGYATPVKIHKSNGLHLTIAPVAVPSNPPSSDDSPIIITRSNRDGIGDGLLAVWAPSDQDWCVVARDGYTRWLGSGEITEWSPAVVTKSGHGVWDERDKRDRIDADGDAWHWDKDFATWECAGDNRGCFGSLDAFRKWYGYNYLVGFADEQGGEE